MVKSRAGGGFVLKRKKRENRPETRASHRNGNFFSKTPCRQPGDG
jgi:hypothetical protein